MSSEEEGKEWPFGEYSKLHYAAQVGSVEEVKALLAQGGESLNAFDELGHTPLHYAVKQGNREMVRLLLDAGADVNAHDVKKCSDTPLGGVAANCTLDMAQMLVDAGADPRIPGWMQITAINRAEKRKKEEGRKVLELLRSVKLPCVKRKS